MIREFVYSGGEFVGVAVVEEAIDDVTID